jgi:nitrogen-specific signal transduction histidine kinase
MTPLGYTNVFELAPIGIAIVGGAPRTIRYINPAFAAMVGVTAEQLSSKPFRALWVDVPPSLCGASCVALRTRGQDSVMVRVTGWPNGSDGTHVVLVAPCGSSARGCGHELNQLAQNMAHQLRNPITGIGSALRVLRGRQPWPSGSPEHVVLDEILHRLGELDDGVASLLQYVRPLDPTLERISAFEVALSAADAMRATELGDIPIDVHRCETAPPVRADPTLLERAVIQLLRNGAEANGRAGICVAVQGCSEHCIIDIRDHGDGCSGETIERMFEPFYTTKHAHFGVGLADARRIALVHEGSLVCVHSDHEGTLMRMTIPRDGQAPELRGSPQ